MDAKQVTAELVRSYNFLDMPIGVYVVAPNGRFIACNRRVRDMLALPPTGEIDANITDFYADPSQRPELLRRAEAAEAEGNYLEREIIQFRVHDREIYVEDYCKPLRDDAGNKTGYLGCLVDVTAEQEKVRQLTFDIGNMLHANTSTLLMVQQTLDVTAETLTRRGLKDILTLDKDEIGEQLLEQALQLANALERLTQTADPERRAQALSEHLWHELTNLIPRLRQVRENVPIAEDRPSGLRRAAHDVLLICQEITASLLSRDSIREVQRAAEHMERNAALYDVLTTREAIIQMDATLRTLRDFITAGVRAPEERTLLSVKSIVEQIITHLAEFAKSAQVEIVWREREGEAQVFGSERDLVRALSNLLHNAIKYTWRRDRTRASWVTIRTLAHEKWITIEFENWGVPIAPDEIEKGLIYQLGYRGKWSRDRGRLGTGIGLTDAQSVAIEHNGDLSVESRPATPGMYKPDDEKYFRQPFITIVRMDLPNARYR